MRLHAAAAALLTVLLAAPAAAQTPATGSDVYLRGRPAGQATGETLRLTLADAVRQALANNLGVVLEEQRVRAAEAARLRAVGDLLPRVTANLRDSDQVVNLAAFGFTGFPGIPDVIGPFTVFDARVALSVPLFDAAASNTATAERAAERAEQHTYRNVREVVILVVANLYFEAVADASRVDAMRAQVTTAETLYRLATDEKASGLIAGIDVLRQQVQLESAKQRLIVVGNALSKLKLRLARAIGLPVGQAFELADRMPFTPASRLDLGAAVDQAYANRDDLKSAEALVDAAHASLRAARSARLPTLHFDADYGKLGSRPSDVKTTYAAAATLHVPLFTGGVTRGRVEQADADARQREAELADLRAGIRYEVEAALLDLDAAGAAVDVARNAESLASQQLEQAQDRFRAGVSSTIELAQAQDALSSASDVAIASLYAYNVAKASLARALGLVEERFADFVGGQR